MPEKPDYENGPLRISEDTVLAAKQWLDAYNDEKNYTAEGHGDKFSVEQRTRQRKAEFDEAVRYDNGDNLPKTRDAKDQISKLLNALAAHYDLDAPFIQSGPAY